jgi:hypothetical protein
MSLRWAHILSQLSGSEILKLFSEAVFLLAWHRCFMSILMEAQSVSPFKCLKGLAGVLVWNATEHNERLECSVDLRKMCLQ